VFATFVLVRGPALPTEFEANEMLWGIWWCGEEAGEQTGFCADEERSHAQHGEWMGVWRSAVWETLCTTVGGGRWAHFRGWLGGEKVWHS
jgi:hypothetical protein